MATKLLFPLAFVLNAFAMTGVLILLGLAGENAMAAEVGIIQAATIALFYAFSANARSLILNQQSSVDASDVLYIRSLLLLPLSVAAYYLSSAAIEVEYLLAVSLIFRRAVEWLQEVRLSQAELVGNHVVARNYVIYQSTLLALVAFWIVSKQPGLPLILLVWAVIPLAFDMRYIIHGLCRIPPSLKVLGMKLMPHLGSSLIIGISVYLFRLLLVLVTGKVLAGDLFTAFAIGGIFGSVFANALGASVAFNESRTGVKQFPGYVSAILGLFAAFGLLIFALAWLEALDILLPFKSYFFFMALGLSMLGGVLMVYAQRLRFRLLQKDAEHDVFGPDVLINLLLIASVPLIAYTLGRQSLVLLYLLSAILCLIFYMSAKNEHAIARLAARHSSWLNSGLSVLAVLLALPVFFQLDTGLFRDASDLFDSGGVLVNVPIPVSLLACFVGIVILAQFRRALESFGVIFFTCTLLTLSSLIVTNGDPALQRVKFVFLIQFLLPMFGLVLGQMYVWGRKDTDSAYLKGFFIVMLVLLPWQLAVTVADGRTLLAPYLGLFSIYQHLDYVPVVFTAIFVLLLPRMWSSLAWKSTAFFLGITLTIYLSKSLSSVAPWVLVAGLTLFSWMRFKLQQDRSAVILLVSILISGCLLLISNSPIAIHQAQKVLSAEVNDASQIKQDRLSGWAGVKEYSVRDIYASGESFFFGHPERPARTQQMDTKNYYLDLAFNFGVISLIPILCLLLYTAYLVRSRWYTVSSSIDHALLLLVVLCLVVMDNSVQVGLRQPYSGIFTFFLWGLLLATLNQNKIINKK